MSEVVVICEPDPCSLAAAVTAIAVSIASRLDDDELDVVSSVFTQLGDTLETIASQRTACKRKCNK